MNSAPKKLYADRCFGLPVEQVKYYDELPPALKNRCQQLFGKTNVAKFVYAIKKSGDDLVDRRERLRPEWGDQ